MKTKARGAPRGNRNAWKHGLYSSAFNARERRLLSRTFSYDLAGEIELIRIANYRLLQALETGRDQLDVQTQLTVLRAVNLSAQSITSLIRAQALSAPHLDREDLLANLRFLSDGELIKDLTPDEARAVEALSKKVLGPTDKG